MHASYSLCAQMAKAPAYITKRESSSLALSCNCFSYGNSQSLHLDFRICLSMLTKENPAGACPEVTGDIQITSSNIVMTVLTVNINSKSFLLGKMGIF